MGRHLRFGIAIAVLAIVVGATLPALAGGLGNQEPIRVYTVRSPEPPPAKIDGAQSLLPDRLGEAPASSGVTAPKGDIHETAEQLPQRSAATRRYGNLRVVVHEMSDETTAYALLRYLRPAEAATVETADDAWTAGETLAFRVGQFTTVLEGGSEETRAAAAAALVGRIGRPAPSSPLLAELPEASRIAGTERYAPSLETLRRLRPDLEADVFRMGAGGADAAVADYAQASGSPMRIVLVDYQTPQLAADAERSLMAYFAALPPEVQQQRILRREGNYILEATGVTDRAAAEQILGTVKYSFAIKWLKGYAPPALNLNEETYKAALLFINSFAIVGICFTTALVCGIVVGAVVFRNRRRAAANLFSDAGGMTHLDLRQIRKKTPKLPSPAGLLSSGPGD